MHLTIYPEHLFSSNGYNFNNPCTTEVKLKLNKKEKLCFALIEDYDFYAVITTHTGWPADGH